jgi:glycosyltransferase involved in cell wall biosynthesis
LRVLLIHNRYQQEGGELVAVQLQQELLRQKGHDAEILFFNNASITGTAGKFAAATKSFYNRQAEKQVSDRIESFRPDIVHVHNIFFDASPAVFYACNKLKVPVVLTIHNYRLVCANALLLRNNQPCELCRPYIFPLSGIRYRCYRNSAVESALVTAISAVHKLAGTWKSRVDRYILLTEFARKKIGESSLSLPADKMVVIPNYTADPGAGSPARKDFYLFVGRISMEKGVDIMLAAFSNTRSTLLIAGDGPEKERLMQQYGGFPNIRFLGAQEKPAVTSLMKEAKALVFPSVWYEGLPFTIIESLAAGTPVIASRLGAMEHLVTDRYNGRHFTAGDAASLQEVINNFERAGNDELYMNARQSFLDQYTADAHYMKLMNVYEQLLNRR